MILLFLLLLPVTGDVHLKNSRRSVMESKDISGTYYYPFPTFLLFGFRNIGFPKRHATHEFESNSISSDWINHIKSPSGYFVNKNINYYNKQNQIKTLSKEKSYLVKNTDTKAEEFTNQMESYIMPLKTSKARLYQLGRRQISKREHIRFTRESDYPRNNNSMLRTNKKNDNKIMENRSRRRRETSRKYDKIRVSENSKNKGNTENTNKSYEYSNDKSRNKDNNVRISLKIAEFERFVTRVMSCRQIPALSVALVQKGVPLLVRAFGVADFENSKKASTKTKFFIASLTKSFTSTIIARVLTERRE